MKIFKKVIGLLLGMILIAGIAMAATTQDRVVREAAYEGVKYEYEGVFNPFNVFDTKKYEMIGAQNTHPVIIKMAFKAKDHCDTDIIYIIAFYNTGSNELFQAAYILNGKPYLISKKNIGDKYFHLIGQADNETVRWDMMEQDFESIFNLDLDFSQSSI